MVENMNKHERIQKRQRRLDLTHHLSILEKTHCHPCDKRLGKSSQNQADICKGCPIYTQIRAIGKELMGGEVIKPGKKGRPSLNISVEAYNDLKATGLKDELIAKKLNISLKSLSSFKTVNGLTIKRNVSKGKLVSNNDVGKGESDMNENESLKDQLVESQSEIHRLSAQNESLKTQNASLRAYEEDYRKLEIDYLNGQTENKRLLEMLEKLKRTTEINVWLMEQHVGFMSQVEKNEESKRGYV